MLRVFRKAVAPLFAALFALAAPAWAATHTIDTFAGTAGTALESHTPDSGGPWTNTGGDAGHMALSGSGRLSLVSTTNAGGVWNVPVGTADMYAAITIAPNNWGSSTIYVAVRVQDQNNMYYFGHNSSTGFFIRKLVAGTFTTLASITSSISPGDVFKLEVIGNTLTAYKNGVSIGTATDGTFTSQTSAGLLSVSSGNAASMFSQFESDTSGSPPATTVHALGALGAGG